MAKKKKSKKKMPNVAKMIKEKEDEIESEVRKGVRAASYKGKDALEHEAEEVERFVRKEPLKAVGVAFAVGFLLGKMMR